MHDHRWVDVVRVVVQRAVVGDDAEQALDEGAVFGAGAWAQPDVVDVGDSSSVGDHGGDGGGVVVAEIDRCPVVGVAVVLGELQPVEVAAVGEVGVVGGNRLPGVEQFPKAVIDSAEQVVHPEVDGGVDMPSYHSPRARRTGPGEVAAPASEVSRVRPRRAARAALSDRHDATRCSSSTVTRSWNRAIGPRCERRLLLGAVLAVLWMCAVEP